MNYGSVTILSDHSNDFLDTESEEEVSYRSDDFLDTNSASDSEDDVPVLRDETEEEISERERRRNLCLVEGRAAYVNVGEYLERNILERNIRRCVGRTFIPVRREDSSHRYPVLAPAALRAGWEDLFRTHINFQTSVDVCTVPEQPHVEISFVQPVRRIAKTKPTPRKEKRVFEREKEYH